MNRAETEEADQKRIKALTSEAIIARVKVQMILIRACGWVALAAVAAHFVLTVTS